MNRVLYLLPFLLAAHFSFATHQVGGEVSFRHLSNLTYEITITTYTKASSAAADRCELVLHLGDGVLDTVARVNGPSTVDCPHAGEMLSDVPDRKKNIYTTTYTYAGPGSYTVFVSDPNRNADIINIPNSVNEALYFEAELNINPFTGTNSSVFFEAPPIMLAAVDHPYIHNVTAIDPDADSLSFGLVPCRGDGGDPIAGYSLPSGVNINALNGEITWMNPTQVGAYSFAVKVTEWRDGTEMGYVVRDFQLTVINSNVVQQFLEEAPITTNPLGDAAISVQPTNTETFDVTWFNSDTVTRTLKPYSELAYHAVEPLPTFQSHSDSCNALVSFTPVAPQVRPHPYIYVLRGTVDGVAMDFTVMYYVGYPIPAEPGPGTFVGILPLHAAGAFPNPASQTVSLPALSDAAESWRIYDSVGRLMNEASHASLQKVIDVSGWPNGVYFYRVSGQQHGKFVVAH